MLLEKLPLGKTLEIFVDREDYRYRLVSKVEDTNPYRVCVTAIASNGKYFEFHSDDKIQIVYRDEEIMWEWDNVKAGLAKLGNDPVHYFQIVDKGKTFNRRNAYRVKILEDVLFGYYVVPQSKKKFSDPQEPVFHYDMTEEELQIQKEKYSRPIKVHGMIKDVSENGAGIYCDSPLEVGDEIFFDIPSSYGNLSVKAQIIRIAKVEIKSSKYKFYYGCVLTQTDRKLLRYIFDLQREILRKQKAKEDGYYR